MQTAHCNTSCLLACAVLILMQTALSCRPGSPSPHPTLLRAEQLMSEHPDTALVLLQDSIDADNLSGKNYADWCLLLTQARDRNYVVHTSDSLLRVALEYYEDGKNPDRLMLAWYYMGRVSQDLNDAIRAQKYYLKALEAGKSSDDIALKARICNNVGMLYTYQKAFDQALKYMQEGLTYLEQLGDTSSQSFVLRDIARTYRQLDSLDLSILYYQNALPYSNSDNNASILSELGGVLATQKKFDEAVPYLRSAVQVVKWSFDSYPIYLTLGRVYREMGKLDSARFYSSKSMDSNQLQTQAGSYYQLARIAKTQKKYEEYISHQEQYELLSDSLQKYTHTQDIQRMQALFSYQQAEKEAEVFKLNHALAQRNFHIAVLVAVILFVCLGLYIFYLRTEKREGEMQERFIDLLFKSKKEKNEQQQGKIKRQQDALEQFKATDIYHKFRTVSSKNDNPSSAEKREFKEQMDDVFPDLNGTIKTLSRKIRHEEQELSYLVKAELAPNKISILMGMSSSHIATMKTRIFKKLTGKKGSAKDFDKFICEEIDNF